MNVVSRNLWVESNGFLDFIRLLIVLWCLLNLIGNADELFGAQKRQTQQRGKEGERVRESERERGRE